jgi:hypothetical protein
VAIHGKNTAVWWNLTEAGVYLDSASLSIDADLGDTSTFGTDWKRYIGGGINATVGFTGKYDADAAIAIEAKLGVDNGVLTYCPGGAAAIGDRARLVSASATTYAESSPVGDVVTFAWNVQSQAAVGLGQVLHPKGEDTNTTTGATKDDAAATATGWVAHLHVFLVDGGSWVVKLEDSANGSDWADVTGGAFAAATGGTWERITSATGTAALRRYVRYTATRTGGTAGDGIWFALAYARNI